jgi:hypothetical protein
MSATEKISVTIGKSELSQAKRLADRLGLSLSGFLTDALKERIREQARREAAQEVLRTFEAEDRASPEEASRLLKQWSPAPAKVRKSPRVRAASPKRQRKSR